MTRTTGEINALLNLIDDPDEEVFESITAGFIGFGATVIPFLEEHQLKTNDPELVKKTGQIIASIDLSILSNTLYQWCEGEERSILEASLAIAHFLDRETDRGVYMLEIERLRKSIWLEHNDYLTPLEEINIINKIIFEHFKLKGIEMSGSKDSDFSTYQLLTTKTGNALPLGAVYLIMGEMLGIPIKSTAIPKQHLLCYAEAKDPFAADPSESILFFIDPLNGQVYTHRDIENYLKKTNYTPYPYTITASPSEAYVQKWILEIAKCAKEKQDIFIFGGLKKLAASLIVD